MASFRISRRDWLRLSAAGVLAPSLSGWLAPLAARAAAGAKPKKACILLWMNGGPAQGLTFDVKPDGAYKPKETNVPGIMISEHLPKLAQQMKHLALLRGMSTEASSHGAAQHLMSTGFLIGAMKRPALGSIVSHQIGDPELPLPSFVVVDGGSADGLGVSKPPIMPAFLGPRHAPMLIDDPLKGIENLKPAVGADDFRRRAADLDEDNKAFLERHPGAAALAQRATVQRAVSLLDSDKFKALDLANESPRVREAYGTHRFGHACLLARRLVETGVSFVEVTNNGWDDHGGAIDRVKGRSWLDQGFAALLADLHERGLLDSTLVVWMGEFGRTPSLKHGGHSCKAWTTVLAGAGVKGGQVIGRTDKVGDEVAERPINSSTFVATVFKALGIDHTKRIDNSGFAVPIVDKKAQPIGELF